MTSTPDAAAAIVYQERATAALNLSRQMLAQAHAVYEIPDLDLWHGECRREVFRHLTAAADAYEVYADRAREAAHAARSLVPNTITLPGRTLADEVAFRSGLHVLADGTDVA